MEIKKGVGERQNMQKSYRKIRTALIVSLVVVLSGASASAVMYFKNTPKQENLIYEVLNTRIEAAPGVRINGIDISGQTLEEARVTMQNAELPRLGTITIKNGDEEKTLDLSPLLPETNMEEVVTEALEYANSTDSALNEQQRQEAYSQGKNFETTNTYDLSSLKNQISFIAQELSSEPVNAVVKIRGKENPESKADQEYDPSEVLDSASAAANAEEEPEVKEIVQASSPIKIDENGEIQGLDQLFEYIESIPGSKVDENELYDLIDSSLHSGELSEVIEAPITEVPAEIQPEDIKQDFKLISSKTSSFAKGNYSAKNRVFNINKAAEIINGYILEPGDTFAFNDVLGPRVAKYGWKSAGAISGGQSVDEIGGGICQVSSTAYNAVLMADLEIVERHPHSWPLSYIESGQDATISTGGPDFVFKNSREKPVVLVAFVNLNEKTITVQFYGEPSDEYDEIRIVSEQTETIKQPATKYISSGETRKGRSGSRWKTHLEYIKNGEVVKTKDAPKTTYRAIGGIAIKKADPIPSASESDGASSSVNPETSTNDSPSNNDVVEEFDIPLEVDED